MNWKAHYRQGLLLLALAVSMTGCRLFGASADAPAQPAQQTAPPGALPASATPAVIPAQPSPAAGTPQAAADQPGAPPPIPTSLSDDRLPAPPAGDPGAALLPAERSAADLPVTARYRIHLQVDPSGERFSGRQIVQVTNRQPAALDALYFRLLPNGGKSYGSGSLEVSEVRLGETRLQPALSQGDSVLEVPLPEPLAPGAALELDFSFTGQAAVEFGGDHDNGGYGIYNLSDGVLSLANAYPILAVYDAGGWNLDPVSNIGDSVYSETAYYSVLACVPEGWRVAATGATLEGPYSVTGGLDCSRFESGPMRDFYLIAGREFDVLEEQVDGVNVRSYYLPGDEAAAAQTLETAAASLQVFNQRFGPYPFTELELVEAPMRYALGVEYPGVVLIAQDLYQETGAPEFPMTVAHEVAHQWWYSVVGNDVFDAPWLDEGLATYSSALYFEDAVNPQTARGYLDFWRSRVDSVKGTENDKPVAESLSFFEGLDNSSAYSRIVYLKGAIFFDSLRKEIGDEAFFQALQQYYAARRFEVATAQDLLGAFETAAGRSLEDFYRPWLYEPAP
ncbi:MAG: M1 family aminopeptidase [Chloroflexota bacterium]